MPQLLNALQIPEKCIGYQGTTCTGMEGLMIMLRRLAYPNRWCDLVYIFGRPEAELSIIFNMVCTLFKPGNVTRNKFQHQLTTQLCHEES